MAFEEIAVICLTVVGVALIAGTAFVVGEVRKAQIQQAGIDRRAAAKLGGDGMMSSVASPSYQSGLGEYSWLVPIVTELLKIPAIQEMVGNVVKEKLTSGLSSVIKTE